MKLIRKGKNGLVGQVLEPNYGNLRFIRNIGGLPSMLENGRLTIAPVQNALANFTTDLPFRLHKHYSTPPGTEYLILDPKQLKGMRLLSIEPMDTMFPNFTIEPWKVGLLTGNEELLEKATKLGMPTYTSQDLIQLHQNIMKQRAKAPTKGINFQYEGHEDEDYAYRDGIDNYITTILGRPSIEDYRTLENVTGLKAGVEKLTDQPKRMQDLYEEAMQPNAIKLRPAEEWGEIFTYPNGNTINIIDFLKQSQQTGMFDKVFYDPYTQIELDLMTKYGQDQHPKAENLTPDITEEILRQLHSKPIKRKGGKLK